jgi:Fe-S cluster biosynthesis and repair protein YggX
MPSGADRTEEAAHALRKAIEHDPNLSRAYQLLAQILIKQGATDQAGEILTTGYKLAAEQGDVMPQRAMESLLKKIDLPVPEVETPEQDQPSAEELGEDTILDRRTGKPGNRLPDPPMRGPVGRFIYDHYSAETFREWIGQGTKVINELKLDFSNPDHQQVYEQHMMEWLGFTYEEVEEYQKQLDQQEGGEQPGQ